MTTLEVGAKSEAGSVHPYEDRMLVDEGSGLFAVADGVTVSSHGSGGAAADLAIGLLPKAFSGDLPAAIGMVNRLSFEQRKEDRNIGETTLTAAFLHRGRLEVANVGDSPAVLIHHGTATSLIVEDRDRSGHITQVIGYRDGVSVHSTSLELAAGDMVVLASDGVGHVLGVPFLSRLALGAGAEEAAGSIVREAKAVPSGYDDDKTAIVLKVLGGGPR